MEERRVSNNADNMFRLAAVIKTLFNAVGLRKSTAHIKTDINGIQRCRPT